MGDRDNGDAGIGKATESSNVVGSSRKSEDPGKMGDDPEAQADSVEVLRPDADVTSPRADALPSPPTAAKKAVKKTQLGTGAEKPKAKSAKTAPERKPSAKNKASQRPQ